MKPFKVGERVKVYGNLRDLQGNRETFYMNGMPGIVLDEAAQDGSITVEMDNPAYPMRGCVHVRQLRRLLPRKSAREWFIEVDDIAGDVVDVASTIEDLNPRDENTVIRVREVKVRK